jgi:hypothetical protein
MRILTINLFLSSDARGRDMFQKKLSKIEEFSLNSQGQKLTHDLLDDFLNSLPGTDVQGLQGEYDAPIRTFLTGKEGVPKHFKFNLKNIVKKIL